MTDKNHPGPFVRKNVFPVGLSVTDAAKRLGVGRPALSNFLNGKAALSLEMAVRLEKAFGADRIQLLEMQASHDQAVTSGADHKVEVRAFVPKFLTIKARQIENWAATNLDARSHLPVLLRILVHSVGSELKKVDFPGYDNSQRKGSDGVVEAGAATPWIPTGISYWEFGTDENIKKKAETDYSNRLKSVTSQERAESTFIFVTPRNWPGKIEWEKKKNKDGDWKGVRALDASDIEQWLEQSISGQIWLSEQLNLPSGGYETLEYAWKRWAHVCEPHLTADIFSTSISTHRSSFAKWLSEPSNRPFVVAADSREEALAFLSCLFDCDELRRLKDIATIFTAPETLRVLVASFVPFIPIVYSENTERELGTALKRLHCIVIQPRNAVAVKADVSLDLLDYEIFKDGLLKMGIGLDNVDRLGRESGFSPTILRRRLSKSVMIRTPEWADSGSIATELVPIVLTGAWHTESKADREILSSMANQRYEAIEKSVARALQFDDPPLWSIGAYCGVSSKVDALFAIAGSITKDDLNRFFKAAEYVLSESDPSLELPEKDRWAAGIYGKMRNHSGTIRENICETLVILSVHGNVLFQNRLGLNLQDCVSQLIRKLLTPLTLEKILSQKRVLPKYAEAAPEEFLKILEEDLKKKDPVIYGLITNTNSGSLMGSPSRTNLLWALECLAWRPQLLPRVSSILAQLSQIKLDDNWVNKPEGSLKAIFRSWMPQTKASVEQRIDTLRLLINRFPDVAWKICVDQVRPRMRTGSYSYRPHWRSDATGAGHVVTNKEIYEFERKCLDCMLAWPSYDEKSLGDLIEALQAIPEADQGKVWDLIDKWALNASESSKARLREHIRRFAFTRRSRKINLPETVVNQAHGVYERLESKNPVVRHGWLFKESWIDPSYQEIEEQEFDYEKSARRTQTLRQEAMTEIYNSHGIAGVQELLAMSNAPWVVGHFISSCLENAEVRYGFLHYFLGLDGDLHKKAEGCIQGVLFALANDTREAVMRDALSKLSGRNQVRLFLCAPYQDATWRLLDHYPEELRIEYWKDVIPSPLKCTPAEMTEMVDRLLEAKRPRAAFFAIHYDFKNIETSRLKRLLRDIAAAGDEPNDEYRLEAYYISEALSSLQDRPGVTHSEMAQLEFLFISVLDHTKHGIPNLEKQMAESPELFVQALALAYKRNDDGEDPPEWRIEDEDRRSSVATAAYHLLNRAGRIPGMNEKGEIDPEKLTTWVREVRSLCQEYSRSEVGDQCLGQLLSKSPGDSNGIWPCKAVCEAIEESGSTEIGKGFCLGIYNSRGVVTRSYGEGGKQEKDLADKYRNLAEAVRFDYPFVATLLDNASANYERDADREDSEVKINKRIGSI